MTTILSILGIATANAQYSTTTAASQVNSMMNDVAAGFSTNILVILGILGGLLVLGFVIRRFKRYITGKKF